MNEAIPQHVHLVGIGGMHMSAIARILMTWGHTISGSDLRLTPLTAALEVEGARVYEGHSAENVAGAGLVVTTSAAPGSNPELNEAVRLGIPVIKRADMVARLMLGRRGVCVAGSHGKSTTSGLVAYILAEAGRDPTYLIGAEVAGLGTNAAAGSGRDVVVEADEYDRAFLSYSPEVALVLNVEADHLDYYKTEALMREAFAGFAARVVPGGTLLLCADSPGAMALREHAHASVRVVTYGLAAGETVAGTGPSRLEGLGYGAGYAIDARYVAESVRAEAGRQSFRVLRDGELLGEFETRLAGRHNVSNATGAIAIADTLGLSADEIRGPLALYAGVRRRFETVGEAAGVLVMDDYAHHPTEVEALAAAAKSRFPGRRIVALFQPHTYARTRYLLEGWRTCFRGFDRLFLLETYAAREAIADGMTAEQLVAEVEGPLPGYCPDFESAARLVAAELEPGDVFFTVGAGDVDSVGPAVLELLRAREAAVSGGGA